MMQKYIEIHDKILHEKQNIKAEIDEHKTT